MKLDLWRTATAKWALALLTGLALAATMWLFALDRHVYLPVSWGLSAGARDTPLALVSEVMLILYIAPASVMGLLILRNHPRHRIGWLLAWAGLASAFETFIGELTIYSNFNQPGAAGLAASSAWVLNVVWIAPLVVYFWLFSLFPNGRLPSPGWRWIHAAVGLFALSVGGAVLIESPMHSAFSLPNPIWVDFPGRLQLYGFLYGLGVATVLVVALGLAAMTVSRFRQAQGAERQQFKWLGFSAVFGLVLLSLGVVLGVGTNSVVGQWAVNYSLALLPAGVGIAVLRYRLYDIDLVIRRTLVYAALSVLLALVYFGSVVALQSLFTLFTGQQRSELVTVLSTLAIAALFVPIRSRVQSLIDRRFYRRKYDASRTLAGFGVTLRNEVNLDDLSAHLLGVVDETMQPQTAHLWLARKAPGDGSWPATKAER